MTIATITAAPHAPADNKRLNDSVVANVYTVQHQAGCTNDVNINPQLQLAAQWHTADVLTNRSLDGDVGSNGSLPQDRARAAGFSGTVSETVAINAALSISGIELINLWYSNPAYLAIMQDCHNKAIGVWSENSLNRTVVVAVYGQSARPIEGNRSGPLPAVPPLPPVLAEDVPIGPSPDYDASDEIEHGIDWFPWILRGISPPPAYPPS